MASQSAMVGSVPPLGEADRAGIGAGAFRPEADLLGQRIDLEDHAGAGADRVEMQRRHVELEAVHQRLVLDPRLAARDDAHVEGGAAHVRADERVVADQLADIGRTEDAADRAGDHRLVQARMVDRGQAAEGEQRLHAIFEAVFLRDVLDALELLAAARRGVGLDQHRVQPRLFADDRADLVAGVDCDLGAGLLDLLAADLGDALLVHRIDVREDRHDADRPRPCRRSASSLRQRPHARRAAG